MNLSTPAATLLAFVDRRTQWFLVIVYALFAACALLAMLLMRGSQKGELLGTAVFGCAAAFVWAYGASGGLTLLQDARTLRTPSIARAVCSAMSLLFIATVLVPAVVLCLYGGNIIVSSALLACAAFAALLWALLPRSLAMALPFALIFGHLERLVHLLRPHDPGFGSLAWMLALLLGALAAWRMLRLQRQELGPITWSSPVAMGLRQQMRLHSTPRRDNANAQIANLPRYLQPRVCVDELGPQHPVSAMRAWLGSPFAPQNWRQRAAGMGIQLVWMSLLVLFIPFRAGGADAVLLPWCLMGSSMLPMLFQQRLRYLYQRRAGEMSELALLPGWGEARHARRILIAAVFQPLAVGQFALWLVVALLALGMGVRPTMYLSILCVALGVASTWLAFCLRAMADLARSFLLVLPLIAFASALIFTGMTLLATDSAASFQLDAVMKIAIVWGVVSALMGLLALHAYLRFRSRPHPFLLS